jgi:hypothetical protein
VSSCKEEATASSRCLWSNSAEAFKSPATERQLFEVVAQVCK